MALPGRTDIIRSGEVLPENLQGTFITDESSKTLSVSFPLIMIELVYFFPANSLLILL